MGDYDRPRGGTGPGGRTGILNAITDALGGPRERGGDGILGGIFNRKKRTPRDETQEFPERVEDTRSSYYLGRDPEGEEAAAMYLGWDGAGDPYEFLAQKAGQTLRKEFDWGLGTSLPEMSDEAKWIQQMIMDASLR